MDSECQWELRAKIKLCESCGLRNEQELLVPPRRIEGAVKCRKALSVPKGSLKWVCYFNSLRAVLKDNLFLIPPASCSKWFSFLFLPFPPWDHRRVVRGNGQRQEPGSSARSPLHHPPAERCPQLLTPRLNWFQTAARGIHEQWALFCHGGLAAFSFNCGISPALGIPHCSAPSKNYLYCLWEIFIIDYVKCSLLSVGNVHYCLCEISFIVYRKCPLLSMWNAHYCLCEMSIFTYMKCSFLSMRNVLYCLCEMSFIVYVKCSLLSMWNVHYYIYEMFIIVYVKCPLLSVWNIHYCLYEMSFIVCMKYPLLSMWNVHYCLCEMFLWFFFFLRKAIYVHN